MMGFLPGQRFIFPNPEGHGIGSRGGLKGRLPGQIAFIVGVKGYLVIIGIGDRGIGHAV